MYFIPKTKTKNNETLRIFSEIAAAYCVKCLVKLWILRNDKNHLC